MILIALPFTCLKSAQATTINSTSLGLIGAVIFDAILRCENSQSSLDFVHNVFTFFDIFLDFSCIEAIVINDTLDIVGSIGALSFFEAILPARLSRVTSIITKLES